jgi:soluble lytic murein transglycosylase-like protein
MIISDNMERILNRITSIEARLRELEDTPPALNGGEGTSFRQFLTASTAAGTSSAPRATAPANIDALLQQASTESGVPMNLLRAVAQTESGFNPRAVSSAGALGIMQLMPDTANGLGVTDPFDPAQNINAGARYLRQQLDAFGGDQRLALAAYNAGPGAVQRYHGVPPFPETRRYVDNVLALAGKTE